MAIIWYHFGRARSSGAHAILSQSQKPKLCRLYLDRSSFTLHCITHFSGKFARNSCYLAPNQPTSQAANQPSWLCYSQPDPENGDSPIFSSMTPSHEFHVFRGFKQPLDILTLETICSRTQNNPSDDFHMFTGFPKVLWVWQYGSAIIYNVS